MNTLLLASLTLTNASVGQAPPKTLAEWQANVRNEISARRSQSIDAVNETKSKMAGWAWGFSAGSFAANFIPEEVPGQVAIGIAADVLLLVKWNMECKDQYNAAVDLPTNVKDILSKVCGSAGGVLEGETYIFDKIMAYFARNFVGNKLWAMAFEGQVRMAEARALDASQQVAGQMIIRTNQDLAARAAIVAGESLWRERLAEVLTGFIPLIGPTVALAVMRHCTGEANATFHDGYIQGTNAFYSQLEEAILSRPPSHLTQ